MKVGTKEYSHSRAYPGAIKSYKFPNHTFVQKAQMDRSNLRDACKKPRFYDLSL